MRARLLLPTATAVLLGCPTREAPKPQVRAEAAPKVAQGRPRPATPAPEAELVDVQLRTGRTRVGEAVRVHVSGWRASGAPSFEPTIEIEGPAAAERMASEIVEERGDRVRERVDFRIEPSAAGTVAITVLTAAPVEPGLGGPARDPLQPKHRRELTVVVAEALPKAELERLLSTHAGRLERGRALAKQGDYRRALELFNLALAERPDDPTVLAELGWAAFLAGEHSLARRATREGLRHETEARARGALLYNLGRIAEAREREDEAIAAYRRSLEARPGSATVEARLRALQGRRPRATCAAPSCPLSEPVDAIRACELIEEEGCPLFRQRGACRCEVEAVAELEAIGRWRLLTLSEDAEAGINQVHFLLADAQTEIEAETADAPPRYYVFPPLPGSHFHGDLRGGVRSAELLDTPGPTLLRVDFEGTVAAAPLPSLAPEPEPKPEPEPEPKPEQERLIRAWTLLCTTASDGRPSCAAPLLRAYQAPGQPDFSAPLVIGEGGRLSQTTESGAAPTAAELDLEFPGFGVRVLGQPTPAAALFSEP